MDSPCTDGDGFIHVTYSKRRKNHSRTNCKVVVNIGAENPTLSASSPTDIQCDTDHNKDSALRKIRIAVDRMEESEYFESSIETIRESLSTVLRKCLEDTCRIVCYGLGSLCKMTKSVEQFAFLVCMQKLIKIPIEFYDPIFTNTDKSIISEEYNFEVLDINEEGKRTVNELTFFYLPHCEHELTNCLLYANWSPLNLSNCIIVSNGFESVLQGHPSNPKKFAYINKVKSLTCESNLKNNFCVNDVFNDLSVHVFPLSKLDVLDDDFWTREIGVSIS